MPKPRRRKRLLRLLTAVSAAPLQQLAAELARSTGRAARRVDLAGVVGKYLGETEKNLARVLERAERSDVVLLFDEADALFGKRTEVADPQQRHAQAERVFLQLSRRDMTVVVATAQPADAPDARLLRPLRRRADWEVA
jgi:SpoVK/Ycf46/Vps4 family AAA+-type ATPase